MVVDTAVDVDTTSEEVEETTEETEVSLRNLH